MPAEHYDFVVIGSGFGGSVAALRLSEKGYSVLVIEKGVRYRRADFPTTNMDFRRWLWMPRIGARGIFQMTFLDHVTVWHGVGVGGGSLVYAATHPVPGDEFFRAPSWGHLADWKAELAPHYAAALRMLGVSRNPNDRSADRVLRDVATDLGRADHYAKTDVAIYFGEPGVEVADPYFGGAGPARVGCTQCGACQTGCRVGAKNTLDTNYLFFAERLGCRILPETEVHAVRPREGAGYAVEAVSPKGPTTVSANNVVFAGGVMGTVPLLLAMKEDPKGLPRLSDRVGDFVRTNSESLISVCAGSDDVDHSKGIAISSVLRADDDSHVEVDRFGSGSNLLQPLLVPHAPGRTLLGRLLETARVLWRYPRRFWVARTARDYCAHAINLLYMRTLEGSLKFRLGRSPLTGFRRGLVSRLDPGQSAPLAFMPEATDIAWRFAHKVGGIPMSMASETLLGTPTTGHILGGACMGSTAADGVIDDQHRVFGYPGLYVVDGSAVSANPGVNPSLTITALAERALSHVASKSVPQPAARRGQEVVAR